MKKAAVTYLVLILMGAFFMTANQWVIHAENILQLPSLKFPFGTDSLGRNLLLRCLVGAKYSILIGVISALISITLGTLYGFAAGFAGGFLDKIMMRFCDILMSLPHLILMCFAAYYFKNREVSSFLSLIFAISITSWMSFSRLARNLIIKEKVAHYVEAAKASGASHLRIIFYHIWPNLKKPIFTWFILQLPRFILLESFLSFFGLGIQSPETSWGLLIQEGWQTFNVYPHLVIFPSVMLFFTLFALNLVVSSRQKQTLTPQPH